MKAREIEKKFIQFFVAQDHLLVPSISLLPENDPTLLFTSAGMVQFKPYFLGLEKPPSPRMVNVQRCLRTTDIDRVGENARTLSFFEMMGSWSIGDYFKKGAIELAWQFLTQVLGFDKEKLWASYFGGDKDFPQLPADEDSAQFWQQVGLGKDHLVGLGYKDNFWKAAETGPCGPSTEVYLDRGEKFGCGHKNCRPGCDCDRFIEIWNAGVFMQYDHEASGLYQPLPFNSVDTGAGLERMAMILQNKRTVFETDLLWPLVEGICHQSGIKYQAGRPEFVLVNRLADHLRAGVFLIADGVIPANQERGYVLRRLLRRAIDAADAIGLSSLAKLPTIIIDNYQDSYPYLIDQQEEIKVVLAKEESAYREAIDRGKRVIDKVAQQKKINGENLQGKDIFYFTQTFGLPSELVENEFSLRGIVASPDLDQELAQAQKDHRQKSRSKEKFKGGLANNSQAVVAYHTATHLLHQALRQVLGDHVHQAGSNITSQRLRFDFVHPQALTEEQIKQVENIVNQQIKANLPVSYQEKSLIAAKKDGALAFFEGRYNSDKVRVYQIGNFSREVCGGPHLQRTGQMGHFVIEKEKSVGSGKRRIYGILKRD
jgi:alanyl-tRNA synthetase